MGSGRGRKTSDLVIDVEDLACLVLGVRCATSDREIVVSLTMDVTSHRATRNYTVVGTAGTVYCDLMRQEVTLFSQHEQSNLENFLNLIEVMPIGYNFAILWIE